MKLYTLAASNGYLETVDSLIFTDKSEARKELAKSFAEVLNDSSFIHDLRIKSTSLHKDYATVRLENGKSCQWRITEHSV